MSITFDNSLGSCSPSGTASPYTFSYTAGSGATFMGIGVVMDNTLSDPTTASFNSVSATKAVSAGVSPNGNSSIWWIPNPSSGAHTVSVTPPTSTFVNVAVITLFGTDTVSPIGSTNTNGVSSGSTSISMPLTTLNANSWVMDTGFINGGTPTTTATGTNQTRRVNSPAPVGEDTLMNASTQTTTTAGLYGTTYTINKTETWNFVAIEIKVAAVAASQGSFLGTFI